MVNVTIKGVIVSPLLVGQVGIPSTTHSKPLSSQEYSSKLTNPPTPRPPRPSAP